MKLVVLNGSPRGSAGNSNILIRWIGEGIEARHGGVQGGPDISMEVLCLNKIAEHESAVAAVSQANMVLLVFPLYTDCMPGVVMAFIEKLAPLKGTMSGKKLGFVVHSGFPEACHSRHVEKYLAWLAKSLGADYIGTAISPGSEGIRLMPDSWTRKRSKLFRQLIPKILETGATTFDPKLLAALASPERLSRAATVFYGLLGKTGLGNVYWDGQLKKNKAHGNRYARPHA